MQSPSYWLRHTPMTEPGSLVRQFERLPSDVSSLNRITHGLLVHAEWLSSYGVNERAFPSISRATLPVAQRLGALLELDRRTLDEPRAPAQRAVGTCRDFALTLCSFLRAKGTPARLRCGFAAYLSDGWEDHWVCEYWDNRNTDWRLSDPQLDDVTRAKCKVTFDPSDMPREVFLTAGEAWLRCRAGKDNSDRFGHGTTKGLWFMKVNVVRDGYAVNNRETSEWDRWREAVPQLRTVSAEEFPQLDRLARHPEALSGDLAANWLAG